MKKLFISALALVGFSLMVASCSKNDNDYSSQYPNDPRNEVAQMDSFINANHWATDSLTVNGQNATIDTTGYIRYAVLNPGSQTDTLVNYPNIGGYFQDNKNYMDYAHMKLTIRAVTISDTSRSLYNNISIDTTSSGTEISLDALAYYNYPFLHYLLPKIGVGGHAIAVVPSYILLSLSRYDQDITNTNGQIIMPRHTAAFVDITFTKRSVYKAN